MLVSLKRGHQSMAAHTQQVQAFCRRVRKTDLAAYLGLETDAGPAEALMRLERRRRFLEQMIDDPFYREEAEAFLTAYTALRAAMVTGGTRDLSVTTGGVADPSAQAVPDYYRVLGVQQAAPKEAVRRAWRVHLQQGRGHDPRVVQAWRVLGNTQTRLNYDRIYRSLSHSPVDADARVTEPPTDNPSQPPTPRRRRGPTVPETPLTVRIPGPPVRDVVLDDSLTVLHIPVQVSGAGQYRARIFVDHPAMSTRPSQVLQAGAGRHTIQVTFDRKLARQLPATATLSLTSNDDEHLVTFRLRAPASRRHLPVLLATASAFTILLALFIGLLLQTMGATPTPGPSSQGSIDRIPTVASCWASGAAAYADHLDIRTDGMGRVTGFQVGGVTTPILEVCIRDALLNLSFPPTRDGLHTVHRYLIPPPAPGPR